MKTIADKLQQMVGQTVVIEGTFPIPTPDGRVAYAPAKGKLTEVYASTDGQGGQVGFDLLEEGDDEPTLYFCNNLRSVVPYRERRIQAPPKSKIFT